MELSEFAPAKINLALHVVGRNNQGYHKLESLVVFANIGDKITIKQSEKDQLKITGQFASSLNISNDNLIIKALEIYRKNWTNNIPKGLEITLEKNLPIASGIGGGSADCAAMFRLLNQISDKKIPSLELEKLALTLGADIPICINSKPAIMKNIGEIIEPINIFPNAYIVLINPMQKISTKDIFNSLRTPNNSTLPDYTQTFTNLEILKIWLKQTRNDLTAPAIKQAPIIKQIIDEFQANKNCLFTSMSGSGATVFALFTCLNDAKAANSKMNIKWPQFWSNYAPLMSNS